MANSEANGEPGEGRPPAEAAPESGASPPAGFDEAPGGGVPIGPDALMSAGAEVAGRSGRGWNALESLAVFAAGAILMTFIYGGTGGVLGDELGVPAHDSFYHIKMAALVPEHGLLRTFPWLRFCYFTDEGRQFVSHHYGFHMLLAPFVEAARRLTGDGLAGGRWAMTACFGLNLVLFNLLLRAGGIRWRWLWLALFLLMPYQFFTRQAFVRAIGPSLAMMLWILLLLFRERALLAGLAVGAYCHLYLGGVLYGPLIVALYVFAHVFGPAGDRRFPGRLLLATAAGWAAGIAVHPYREGMLEFLRLQVFGTGLSPDIPVGREWKPYNNVWWFAGPFAGVMLGTWTAALIARLRLGGRLNGRELTLLLLHLAFGVLTLKARRFIEYWPVFCLLSAAWLARPLINRFGVWFEREDVSDMPRPQRMLRAGGEIVATLAGLLFLLLAARSRGVHRLAETWQAWAIGGLYAGFVLARALRAQKRTAHGRGARRAGRLITAAGATAGLAAVVAVLTAGPLLKIRRKTRCGYNLPAIREMMVFLKAHSQAGDVVFTDDWDIFPVFFYYNSHNYYIVGLDPKFTHQRRPVLWARYVRISRGQVPANVTVRRRDAAGKRVEEPVHVELSDIRTHFGARFVITDREHTALAKKLARAEGFARLVYPAESYKAARAAPYLVFEIIAEDAALFQSRPFRAAPVRKRSPSGHETPALPPLPLARRVIGARESTIPAQACRLPL